MTDQQRVTDEQLASWERLGRDEPTWTASALVQAVARWVHDIRATLTGAAESHGERPAGPWTPADPVSGGTVQHSGRESGPDA